MARAAELQRTVRAGATMPMNPGDPSQAVTAQLYKCPTESSSDALTLPDTLMLVKIMGGSQKKYSF